METKPLLIFDFFGVLIDEVAHTWLRSKLSNDEANEIIRTLFVACDEGKIDEHEVFRQLGKRTSLPPHQVRDEWNKIGRLKQETVDFIKNNRSRFHFALLSNAAAGYIQTFFDRDQTDKLFEAIYISSDLKLAKPDPKIFQYVLDHFPFPYSNCYMIDDSKNNLIGASQVGIKGIHFSSIEDLTNNLKNEIK